MSMRISIEENDLKNVEQRLGDFAHRAPNVILRSLNRAAGTARKTITNVAKENYEIKATAVREALTVIKPSKAKLGTTIVVKGSPVPLDRFKVSPRAPNPTRKNAIKIGVEKGNSKPTKGAFSLNLNGIKVFQRSGRFKKPPSKGSYKSRGIKREVIDRLFGPSIPQMVDDAKDVEHIHFEAWKTYEKELSREINRILSSI